MRRLPDHIGLALGYFSSAETHIGYAERALNDFERKYHIDIAKEYVSLASDELERLRRVRLTL